MALWRDIHGTHEIKMKSTADGVILSLTADETTEHSVDGRSATATNLRLLDPKNDVIQIPTRKRRLPGPPVKR